MQTITKRELNQHTAAVLDRVTESEGIVVTERGKPRWRVSAVHDRDSMLTRLEREGRYTPPTSAPAPWPNTPGGPSYTDAQVDAVLNEMRGDTEGWLRTSSTWIPRWRFARSWTFPNASASSPGCRLQRRLSSHPACCALR